MKDWKECKLGEVTSYSQGIQIPVDEQMVTPFENSIRFIRIVDFSKNNNFGGINIENTKRGTLVHKQKLDNFINKINTFH